MLQNVDRMWLRTGNSGTTVVLEKDQRAPIEAWVGQAAARSAAANPRTLFGAGDGNS